MKPKGLLLGTGHMGHLHRTHFEAAGVAVQDADGEAACTALLQNDADFALIATPASSHFHYASLALDRGLSVFVEKPLATNADDAKALVKKAREKGVTLFVGQSECYNSAYLDFQKKFNSIRPKGGVIEFIRHHSPSERGKDVSAIWDIGVHDFSLIYSLFEAKTERVRIRRSESAADSFQAELELDGFLIRLDERRDADEPRREIRTDFGIGADLAHPDQNGPDPITREHEAFFRIWTGKCDGSKPLAHALFAVNLAEAIQNSIPKRPK